MVSSPSLALLTTLPHGSTIVECPHATYSDVVSLAISHSKERDYELKYVIDKWIYNANWPGEMVATNSWRSLARARCNSSQCNGPVVILNAAGYISISAPEITISFILWKCYTEGCEWLVTIVPINARQFFESNIIAYSNANFKSVQIQHGQCIAGRQCFWFFEPNATFHIDIKQMYLNRRQRPINRMKNISSQVKLKRTLRYLAIRSPVGDQTVHVLYNLLFLLSRSGIVPPTRNTFNSFAMFDNAWLV